MLRVFEAFAGYGSQSIALRNLGIEYEVVAISEIDKYAIKAYEAIHGPINNLGDICKIDPSDIPDHDLFTYSFPCQDLSVAGKQAGLGKGTRSGLLYECEKVIETKKPKYLLLENVKNLVGKKFKPQFDKWLEYLESLGYTNYWQVLNAKHYGVPQNRERVFVVSILGDHKPYKFADKIPLDKCIADILEDEVDEKYYINKPFHLVDKGHQAELDIKGQDCIKRAYSTDKTAPTLTTMQGGMREPKILIPQATKKGYIEMDLPGVCDLSYPNSKTRRGRVQEGGKVSPTLTAASQDICYIEPKLDFVGGIGDKDWVGDNKKLSRNYPQGNRVYSDKGIACSQTSNGGGLGGPTGLYLVDLPCICASRGRNPENPSDRTVGAPTEQRLEFNTKGTSNTITTVQKDNYVVEPTFRIRKLTPRECFRLMGMKDDDIDKIQDAGISNTQQYKMAGNSIVVNVLEAIFKNLFMEG